MPDDIYDMTIIGAGPTGLFGAFYAGMRQMRTKIIEALPEMGGQLTTLYPEKDIFDVGGFPRISARDLARNLVEQGLQFGPTVCLDERIDELHPPDADGVIRLVSSKGEHFTRTVLISGGIGAMTPNKLTVPGAAEFEGQGVYYFVTDKSQFYGKKLLIIGGGDSAVDWVLNLYQHSDVTLIHRRDVFRAHEQSIKQMFEIGIPIKLFWELKSVEGDGRVQRATIFSSKAGEEQTLDVDAVLINIGFKADLGPIKEWGLELDKRYVVVDSLMRTNIPGVHAAGDLASPRDSVPLNLIATGFAQAVLAVNVAKNYIDPKARIFPGHSSETMSK